MLDSIHFVIQSKYTMTFPLLLRKPSAFLPVMMSLAALLVVLVHVAMYGAAREADEGAAAHVWQALMTAQLPFLLFFAIRWLPRNPGPALVVMAVQAGATVAALVPVFLLKL
jgi:hypothetical protein